MTTLELKQEFESIRDRMQNDCELNCGQTSPTLLKEYRRIKELLDKNISESKVNYGN